MEQKIKAQLIDETDFNRIITRIAHEIIERNKGTSNLAILGMRTRGEFIARRLHAQIEKMAKTNIPLGILDVTLYRDDFRMRLKQPQVSVSDITFDISEKNIILVDDVLYTGRTVRAALCAIMEFGRPATVQLCVLVDRGHKELPITADYVGKNIPTSINEEVKVHMKEIDGEDCINLVEQINH